MPTTEYRYYPDLNPFPGLRAFKESESHLFFGREENINDILRKLDSNHFVAVVGTSGTGKSSLIKAGVLPAIAKKSSISNINDWKIVTITPGSTPIKNLANAICANSNLVNTETKESFENHLIDLMNTSALGLVQGMRSSINNNTALLLLIDQFEEVFRFADSNNNVKSEYDKFVKIIIETVRQRDVPIYVILTLRSDFLGDCVAFDGLPEAINDGHYLVPRMTKLQMKRAITGPIDLAQGKISPRLVQHITNDLGLNPDQLPILQHAMMRCWEYWKQNETTGEPMDLKHFEAIGDLENALSNHADEAFNELNENQQILLEKIFKCLTTKKDDNRGIRRPMTLSSLSEICECSADDVLKCIEPFRNFGRSFILPEIGVNVDVSTVFDISHESLMRGWSRLRSWVDEESESAELYIRICTSAVLNKKGASALWRNPELQLAIDWKAKQKPILAWANLYNPDFSLCIDFIERSHSAFISEKNKKRLRTKIVRSVVASFIVIVSILAAWALFQTSIANKKTTEAERNSEEAIAQKAIAESSREEALSNREIAEKQAKNAAEQAKLADQQKRIALIERSKAEESAKEAENKKQLAIQKTTEAILEKKNADIARDEAMRLRLLAISQNLAYESTQINRDANLSALLVVLSYDLAKLNNGNTNDVSIFDASMKSLKLISKDYSSKIISHPNKLLSMLAVDDNIAYVDNTGVFYLHSITNYSIINKVNSNLNQLEINQSFINPYNKSVALGLNSFDIYSFGKNLDDQKYVGHSGLVRAIAFRKTYPTMISGGRDSKLIFWNNSKAESEILLDSRIKTISSLPEAQEFFVGCENGNVCKINIQNKNVEIFKSRSTARVEEITQTDDGSMVVVGYSDGITQIYSKQGLLIKEILLEGNIEFLEINKKHDMLIVASAGNVINIYSLSNLTKLPIKISIEGLLRIIDIDNNTGDLLVYSSNRNIYKYATRSDWYVNELRKNINRKLTLEEWKTFVGKDIPYNKLNPEQILNSEK